MAEIQSLNALELVLHFKVWIFVYEILLIFSVSGICLGPDC